MKKHLLGIGILAMLATGMAGAQQPSTPVTLEPVSGTIFRVAGGQGANGGVYIGNDSVLLIDSKMDSLSMVQVIAAVRARTDKPIRWLLNTHADGDHVNGNRFLPAGVTFVAHENCRKEMIQPGRKGEPSTWTAASFGVPQVTFQDSLTLWLSGQRIALYYFGIGHTTGDAVIYFPADKVAFVGDQVFAGRTPLIHAWKGGNSFGNVAVLKRMLAYLAPAERFVIGHGDIQDRAGIAASIAAMETRQENVRKLIAGGANRDAVLAAVPQERDLAGIIFDELKGAK